MSLYSSVNNEWNCEQVHVNALTSLTCAGRRVMADSHKIEVVCVQFYIIVYRKCAVKFGFLA